MTKPKETDLYQPIKSFLEGQGYEVKGEVGAADVVAVRPDETDPSPVIVELKTGFSLTLIHQAIDRLALSDTVYVAVPRGKGRAFFKAIKQNTKLCRRLGLGFITVRLKDGLVEVHCDPGPYAPRKSKAKQKVLLREFAKRTGDPTPGGNTRQGLMTAYRQDALRCLNILHLQGPTKASLVAKACAVERARQIMSDNHYGWFEREQVGIYAITSKGAEAMAQYGEHLSELTPVEA